MFRNLDEITFPIETKLLFPVVQRENIKSGKFIPERFALVAHRPEDGKILEPEELNELRYAKKYFNSIESDLKSRKGLLINVNISKGMYWGLMGVGKYSFSPYKIIWLTAGETKLNPKLIGSFEEKQWQANQSLQAFMPFESKSEAEQKLKELKELATDMDSELLGTPGTLGWGQPGRFSNILRFK
jgi:hypothetical protein